MAPTMSAQTQASDDSIPDLSGISVLITGTSSGFGQLRAEPYARLGAKVFATMRTQAGGGNTDPMDVPRVIADLMEMAQGSLLLRHPVHPTYRPQEEMNAASAKAQIAMLGESPLGPLVRNVPER